jgi:glycerol-3-phosphate dehydrogenase (NAD(P)+)
MGLVCANLLADHPSNAVVRLWGHNASECDVLALSRRSPRLLGTLLDPRVSMQSHDAKALAEVDVIVNSIPVQFIREVWTRLAAHVPAGAGVVNVSKGIETTTMLRPSQVIAASLREAGVDSLDGPPRAIATLTGPTIATELARCLPAAMVVASDDAALAERVQQLFGTKWLRIYTHHDLLGIELAGAVKNVIAIAAGICDGLQAGSNAKSALLARGLAELTRLGTSMGASPQTFFGVAGVGDLATTCFSPEGRNRSCGEALGKGMALDAYLASIPFVVEGVQTTKGVMELARKYRVEMPIVSAVHAVLFESMDPIDAIGMLMQREQKAERVG